MISYELNVRELRDFVQAHNHNVSYMNKPLFFSHFLIIFKDCLLTVIQLLGIFEPTYFIVSGEFP